jgi:integrase
MMKRKTSKLPVAPGRYGYRHGLYLIVRGANAGSWFFRYSTTVDGRKVRREMGLGSAIGPAALSVEQARAMAADAAVKVRAGLDPVLDREAKRGAERAAEKQAEADAVTFWQACEAHIKTHQDGWKTELHASQWEQSLRDHAKALHDLSVGAITTEHVLAVLRPIWTTKPVTAGRVRGRLEAVLDGAKVRGLRSGENPARWKGHLALMLPKPGKVKRVRHHPAMPWRDVPAFLAVLGAGLSARALAFTILTAVRSGEAFGARWSEIAGDVWIIPPERTKTSQQHRVPLSAQALAILEAVKPLRRDDGFVFPGDIDGWPISNMAMLMTLRRLKGDDVQATVHGFRSSFRDWCADSGVPRELAEACLAHTAGGTERAYYRSDVIDLRRDLMQRWADHCLPPAGLGSNVVPLVAAV